MRFEIVPGVNLDLDVSRYYVDRRGQTWFRFTYADFWIQDHGEQEC